MGGRWHLDDYFRIETLEEVEEGFAEFSSATGRFGGYVCLETGGLRNPMFGGKLMGEHALFYRR